MCKNNNQQHLRGQVRIYCYDGWSRTPKPQAHSHTLSRSHTRALHCGQVLSRSLCQRARWVLYDRRGQARLELHRTVVLRPRNSGSSWHFHNVGLRNRKFWLFLSTCSSSEASCSAGTQGHLIWTSDALLLRYAKEPDITATTLNLAVEA